MFLYYIPFNDLSNSVEQTFRKAIFRSMRIIIIPISRIYRRLRMEASRILGEDEVKSLESDVITPVTTFVGEVYDDTVGDAIREQRRS